MTISTANAFLAWHMTASSYDEFLNQRIQSSLAYQICRLDKTAVSLLPTAGLIAIEPDMLPDGYVDPPTLNLWVLGVDDEEIEQTRAEWELLELRPFGAIHEFLRFEQEFLDLTIDRTKTWDTMGHEERVVAAISFLGLIKPWDWIFHRGRNDQVQKPCPRSH